MPSPNVPPRAIIRGTLLLVDSDAELFMRIASKRNEQLTKPIKTVDIVREALRCYAEQLNVNVTPQR